MSQRPRILASFVHGTLEAIDCMDGDLGRAVRDALKPETRDAIENAWAASWLPIGHDVELTEAFFALAGRERACRAMRSNLASTFQKPILRPLVEGALRIFGSHDPRKLLRWAPRAWSLLFRNVGEMSAEIGLDRATVELLDLPPEVADSREYLLGTAAAISAIYDLTGFEGTCELLEHGDGKACFELHWQVR